MSKDDWNWSNPVSLYNVRLVVEHQPRELDGEDLPEGMVIGGWHEETVEVLQDPVYTCLDVSD